MRASLHTTAPLIGLLAATLIAGCGGGALDGALTEPQRDALTNAWTQRTEVVAEPDLPPEKVVARARGLTAACKELDTKQPLLKAVAETCGPTSVHAKLAAVLPERCVTPAAVCKRAVNRIVEANDQMLASLEALNAVTQQQIETPECRAEFVTTTDQLQGYKDRTRAYEILALGAERKDTDIMQLGRNRIADANVLIARTGDARVQRQQFLDACGVDPPGT